MAGGTKLEPGPDLGARPTEALALVPPRSHRPPEPPGAGTDAVASTGVTTPPPAPSPSPTSLPAEPTPGRTRRLFLRAMFALGVIGGTAAALTPILRTGPRKPAPPGAGADAAGPPAAELFDEMYGGRHIKGTEAGVTIDGRPLHMMRRADGSYVSVVNHFESFPTALATARAAVDDLGATRLALAGPALH
ncbi:tyrosinase family oxidase copper chaperone [Streptomyces sp. NPDC058653]|uniref:tyrosinase family oxidase copper chaperone n=1 Tax=Streptomyces sp. NPDC058653 TaxID=3346576 RepID=UPI00364C1333